MYSTFPLFTAFSFPSSELIFARLNEMRWLKIYGVTAFGSRVLFSVKLCVENVLAAIRRARNTDIK